MRNCQPIEKKKLLKNGDIEVCEIFYTLQGEGPFIGTPAVFIRLAGCNLQCPMCDTDYTHNRFYQSPKQLSARATQLAGGPTLVVITGGEPFRQNLAPLFSAMMEEGHYVQVETNGTLAPCPAPAPFGTYRSRLQDRAGIYIVVSPKTGAIHKDIDYYACAFKYVLSKDSISEKDGLPIKVLGHSVNTEVARPKNLNHHPVIPIYVQPADEGDPVKNTQNRKAAIASCLKHGYIFTHQLHKMIGLK